MGAEWVVVLVVVAVSALELFVGEFEVEVEDGLGLGFHSEAGEGLSAGDGVGDLYGEDAFAESGVGEEEADFLFEPALGEEHVWYGLCCGAVECGVGAFDFEELVGGGAGLGGFCFEAVDECLGGVDGVEGQPGGRLPLWCGCRGGCWGGVHGSGLLVVGAGVCVSGLHVAVDFGRVEDEAAEW